jgi:hypothetical protein
MSEELKILSEDVAHIFKALARLQQEVNELRAEQKAMQRIETIKMLYDTRLQLVQGTGSDTEAKALQDLSDAITQLKEALNEPEEPNSQGDQGDNTNGQESQGSEGIQPEVPEEDPEIVYP